MLKRDITYEDFNGEKITETFYFNLTRTEIIDLETSVDGGLEAAIQRMIKSSDIRGVITEVKKIVLMAYGIKDPEGKRFIKSDKLREEFSQTAAFDELFMELASSDDAATRFIKGVIPKEVAENSDKPTVPPLPAPKIEG